MRAIGFGGLYPGMVGMSRGRRKAGVAWTVDATSGIAVPANATEWSSFRGAKSLSVSTPNSLYLCQEPSGNLLDSLGSVPLTKSGSPIFDQSVSGWSAKGAGNNDNGTGQFTAGVGVGPDPSTTSQTWYFIISFGAAPPSLRILGGIGISSGSTNARLLWTTAGKIEFQINGTGFNSVQSYSSGVHPVIFRYDRTNGAVVLYTDLEKLTATYSSGVVDSLKGFGSASIAAGALALYGARWDGAHAEQGDSAWHGLLAAQGFSMGW